MSETANENFVEVDKQLKQVIAETSKKEVEPQSRPAKGDVTPEYVEMLRTENKERRLETEMLSKKLSETEENTKKALEQVKNLHQQAEQKMVRADLKVFANKYGLRDLEDVKLADLSGVKVDSNGDVAGVEEALRALKDKKPYLFAEVSTSRPNFGEIEPASSSTTDNGQKTLEMTSAEYKKFEENFLSNIGSTSRY